MKDEGIADKAKKDFIQISNGRVIRGPKDKKETKKKEKK
jgi:hypothetical protein